MKQLERTPRILVVDDDSSFRCLVTQELARTFSEVVPAESAARALQPCDEANFDVILPRDLPNNMNADQGAPLYQLEKGFPSLRDLELKYIQNLLKRFSGHRRQIAATLGISERSLYRKLREYGLDQVSDSR